MRQELWGLATKCCDQVVTTHQSVRACCQQSGTRVRIKAYVMSATAPTTKRHGFPQQEPRLVPRRRPRPRPVAARLRSPPCTRTTPPAGVRGTHPSASLPGGRTRATASARSLLKKPTASFGVGEAMLWAEGLHAGPQLASISVDVTYIPREHAHSSARSL